MAQIDGSEPTEATAVQHAPTPLTDSASAAPEPPHRALGRTTAPARRRTISVIVIARNEAAQVAECLRRLQESAVHEIILVDGRSDDGTPAIARDLGATVVTSPPGRGRQLNRGATAATGNTFLFLHADTRLPPDFDQHVQRLLDTPGVVAGAFRLRIDGYHRSFRLIERLVDWRSRRRGLPYGDQAIFMTAETFHRVGGAPDWPVLEDYDLARRLRRLGRIEMAPVHAVTSARRWEACGIWRTTLLNQACLLAFHLGVSPERIARWRRMIR